MLVFSSQTRISNICLESTAPPLSFLEGAEPVSRSHRSTQDSSGGSVQKLTSCHSLLSAEWIKWLPTVMWQVLEMPQVSQSLLYQDTESWNATSEDSCLCMASVHVHPSW